MISERIRKIKNALVQLRYDIDTARFDLHCQWRKFVVLRWHRLWIRKDEFHQSLDMDALALCAMDEKEKNEYLRDLVRRRNLAHERDLRMESP